MTIKVLIGVKFDENLKNQFWKTGLLESLNELSAWKLLDCRILLQIPQGFWEPWGAPRPPTARCAIRDASRRTPLWKFLPTGLYIVDKLFYSCLNSSWIPFFEDRLPNGWILLTYSYFLLHRRINPLNYYFILPLSKILLCQVYLVEKKVMASRSKCLIIQ